MAWHCQKALSLSFSDRSSWKLSGTFVILLCAEERERALGNVHVDIVQCLWKWTIDWLHLTSARLCECIQAWVNNLTLPCCYTSEMCIYNGHPFWLFCLHSFNNRTITKWKSVPGVCLPHRWPTALLSVPISIAVYAKVTYWINVSRSLSSSPCSKVNCMLRSGKAVEKEPSETAGNFWGPEHHRGLKEEFQDKKEMNKKTTEPNFLSFRMRRLALHRWTRGGCMPGAMPHNSDTASDHPAYLLSHGGMHDGMCPAVLDSSGEVLCFFREASGNYHTERVI